MVRDDEYYTLHDLYILIFYEGSAGFLTDLTFNGGKVGASVGNQQYTMRNLVFNNCVTAIQSGFTWVWVYQGISINNCKVGLDMSVGGSSALGVGSITLIDSSITNTPVGILTGFTSSSQPATANSLIVENLSLNNVPVAVQEIGGATLLAGGTLTVAAWGQAVCGVRQGRGRGWRRRRRFGSGDSDRAGGDSQRDLYGGAFG